MQSDRLSRRRDASGLRTAVRRARFAVLERLVLPLAILPLRLLIASWRRRGPDPAVVDAMCRSPRVVCITFHGMLLHLLAFVYLERTFQRRFVVLLSPSLDGRLLAAGLRRFGVDHVTGTSGSRGVAGAVEFIRRIERGDIGVIAADGPRGPCGIAKAGTIRLAGAADAALVLTVTSGGRGLRFGSWDRAHLPLPFARVELSLQLLPAPIALDEEQMVARIQAELVSAARAIDSPVLPDPT